MTHDSRIPPRKASLAMSTGSACNFASDYEIGQSPVMLEIEQRVRGSAYGATSWTTRAQAETAAARLGLATGRRLLELGGGSGWPALFFATVSGCEVVVTDLPLSGLRIARARAVCDGLDNRCSVLAADGAALPFADRTFDRIHHADVLCCMERKRDMLRECRRVGRDGAAMEFSVIALAREARGEEEQQLLAKSGPPYPDGPAGSRRCRTGRAGTPPATGTARTARSGPGSRASTRRAASPGAARAGAPWVRWRT